MEIVSPIISSAISFALGKAYNWIVYSVSYKEKDSYPFMVLLGHMLVQTLKNFDMQTYLYNLRNFTLRTNTPNPYAPLIEWGKNADVLGKDFFDETNKSGRYVKTMNW